MDRKDVSRIMTVPGADLPDAKTLLKVFFDLGKGQVLESRERDVFFYSRGMWAFHDVIKALIEKRGKEQGVVCFPDYFCNEALEAVRDLPVRIEFYPVDENLAPDWDALKNTHANDIDVFVLVHYFGFTNDVEKAKSFCREYGISLIEDAAHVFRSRAAAKHENITIYSPRKVWPIPEGGMLVVPEGENLNIDGGKSVFLTKTAASWLVKKYTQKALFVLKIPWHRVLGKKKNSKERSEASSGKDVSSEYSRISSGMLFALEENGMSSIRKRQENYKLFRKEIGRYNVDTLFPELDHKDCPYVFPVLVRNNRDVMLEKLRKEGVPAISWPDLPPEVLENGKKHERALRVQRSIILFPVHQGLSEREMKYMSFKLGNVLNMFNEDSV